MRFIGFFTLSLVLHVMLLIGIKEYFWFPHKELKKEQTFLSLDIQTFHTVVLPKIKNENIIEEKKPEMLPTSMKKSIVKPFAQKKVNDAAKSQGEVLMDEEHPPQKEVTLEKPIVEEVHVKASINSQEVIFEKIEEAILKHKQYPKRAQRESLEGEITVKFVWTKEGLQEVQIVKSSAHKILNEYTKELIKKASHAFPTVDAPIEITVPIGFTLKGA